MTFNWQNFQTRCQKIGITYKRKIKTFEMLKVAFLMPDFVYETEPGYWIFDPLIFMSLVVRRIGTQAMLTKL